MNCVIDASTPAAWLADAPALALLLQHPACDSFYLALAQRTHSPLVTADRRLHARCHVVDAVGLGESVSLLDTG